MIQSSTVKFSGTCNKTKEDDDDDEVVVVFPCGGCDCSSLRGNVNKVTGLFVVVMTSSGRNIFILYAPFLLPPVLLVLPLPM